jgi:hypothetical protein
MSYDIRGYKLVSGMEIVGKYSGTNDDGSYLLDDAVMVIADLVEDRQSSSPSPPRLELRISPLSVLARRATATVHPTQVLCPLALPNGFINDYVQLTSGIAIVPEGVISQLHT